MDRLWDLGLMHVPNNAAEVEFWIHYSCWSLFFIIVWRTSTFSSIYVDDENLGSSKNPWSLSLDIHKPCRTWMTYMSSLLFFLILLIFIIVTWLSLLLLLQLLLLSLIKIQLIIIIAMADLFHICINKYKYFTNISNLEDECWFHLI